MKTESVFQFMPDGATMDGMLAILAQAGYSNTGARRAVLQAMCEVTGQAGPADLLALGRAYHPQLGLVTVYRTLEILEALGLVRRLHTEDGCHTYALAGHDHGHHIICQRCQRALEFQGCDIDRVVDAVQEQTGFKISGHWLEVFGLCPECQAAVGPSLSNE